MIPQKNFFATTVALTVLGIAFSFSSSSWAKSSKRCPTESTGYFHRSAFDTAVFLNYEIPKVTVGHALVCVECRKNGCHVAIPKLLKPQENPPQESSLNDSFQEHGWTAHGISKVVFNFGFKNSSSSCSTVFTPSANGKAPIESVGGSRKVCESAWDRMIPERKGTIRKIAAQLLETLTLHRSSYYRDEVSRSGKCSRTSKATGPCKIRYEWVSDGVACQDGDMALIDLKNVIQEQY